MSLRSTLLSCFTALTCVAAILAYSHKYLRYSLVGNENGVFVLDRSTTLLHHCDKDNCKLITPQGTTIEMMRQMSGIPNAQDVLSQPTCGKCVTSVATPKFDVTSFQSVTPESKTLSPDMLAKQQESAAKDVGMPVMAKSISAVNPFPSDTNTSSSASSTSAPTSGPSSAVTPPVPSSPDMNSSSSNASVQNVSMPSSVNTASSSSFNASSTVAPTSGPSSTAAPADALSSSASVQNVSMLSLGNTPSSSPTPTTPVMSPAPSSPDMNSSSTNPSVASNFSGSSSTPPTTPSSQNVAVVGAPSSSGFSAQGI